MAQRVRIVALAAVVAFLAFGGGGLSALAGNDPYRAQQWSLDHIGAPEAWQVTRGEGVVVAVIDTGVSLHHPDLVDRFVRDEAGRIVGVDILNDGPPFDRHGHGTLVAGVIAATEGNGEGIAGVAPGVSILPVRVLDEDGAGRGRDVDAGIRWAVDNGADVINLSLESVPATDGTSAGPGAPSAAVEYAWERGVAVVAAVGNNGGHLNDYPDDSPVVLVGAVDREGRPATFAKEVRGDIIYAPGVDIVSTWCRPPGGGRCQPDAHTYGLAEGTSFAAPHVAGVLALLRAAGYDHQQAVDRLWATTRTVASGDGDAVAVLDAAAALGLTGSQAAAAAPERPAPAAGDAATSGTDLPAPPPAPPVEPPSQEEPVAPQSPPPAPTPAPTPTGDLEALPLSAEPPLLLELLAAALVGAAIATWSVVARYS